MFIELIDKKNQNTFGNLKAIKLLSDDGVINNGVKLYIDGVEPVEMKSNKCTYKSIEIISKKSYKWEIVEDEPIIGPINFGLYGFNPNMGGTSAITWAQFYNFIRSLNIL